MAAIAPRLVRSFSSSAGHLQMIKPPIQLFGLEGRYATALYSASVKEKKLEAVEKELLEFQGLLKKDQKLKEFLLNPTLKRNIKKEALLSVFKKQNTSSISSNFFNAIADNGRMNRVESMINAFKTIMSAHRGEVQCEVTTAKPLDKAMEQELHEALKGFLKSGQKLLLHTKVDPSIIGGMIIAVGDKYVDMSMSSKIKKYFDLISASV
ncbi:unnamed protein product [Darwinula stevensoni]|uniref:Oligomycin sensitivity conferral protein n=1 Tax=Darwinula stevensoni TaxID=69355 RepID=A0A7R8XKV8_9CRUS|nr:unnamed protein product [Darwinula stevensoni]CAG0895664.1 unnamed protein product [Darwinula stevensoni]